MDTSNRFMVGANGRGRVMCLLPIPQEMSREDALNLAAYIVVLADPDRKDFDALLRGIENT